MFEVSTPINWLDAQSSCAIWGGDLTSITTERENNYLNTIITSSVGDCWIGLNDRDLEGTYTWTDGTAISYTNFSNTPSNEESNDCVEIDTISDIWVTIDCDTIRSNFLCERDSTVTTGLFNLIIYFSNSSFFITLYEIFLESRFVVLINGLVLYQPLTIDVFLYHSTLTLVYGIGDFSGLVWGYSTNSDLSNTITLTANFTDFEIGFTSLTVDNSMQGYYFYELNSATSFIIGLYDDFMTTGWLLPHIMYNLCIHYIKLAISRICFRSSYYILLL